MMLTIRLNGAEYTNFTEARVFWSMESAASAFSFTSSANEVSAFPLRVGDIVEVRADSAPVLTGYIEKLTVVYDARMHRIAVSGRSLLCDMIDSTVKTRKEFSGGTSLVSIARAVLDDLGMSKVEVVDASGGVDPFDESEITSARVGDQTAFEFLESFARKRQVLINTSPSGSLVLSRGGAAGPAPIQLRNYVSSDVNNILSAEMSLDHVDRYNSYVVKSQLNPVFLGLGISAKNISDDQLGAATDTQIRASRYYEMQAEESSDAMTSAERAAWECNIRRARSMSYKATVQGHTFDGALVHPNMIVDVIDELCDLASKLLVKSVEMVYTLDGGSLTTMDCTYKDAYTLQAEQSQRDAAAEETGGQFEDLGI